MNILVIGAGGREHAIIWKLKCDPLLQASGNIYCIPGNGGISKIARCIDLETINHTEIIKWAIENEIDLTVVGPEAPLADGIVDDFEKNGLKIFGPSRAAAKLESSKIFAKKFMSKYNIPTAGYEIFNNYESAVSYLSTINAHLPTVVKADCCRTAKMSL